MNRKVFGCVDDIDNKNHIEWRIATYNSFSRKELALQDDLLREAKSLHGVASSYRREYRRLIGSRLIKAWLSIRARLGKRVDIFDETVPAVDYLNRRCYRPEQKKLIDKLAACGGVHNPSASYYSSNAIRIGIVTDLFMYDYYKDACCCEIVTPANYKEVIGDGAISALLYVTCWQGITPDGKAANGSKRHSLAGDAGIKKAVEMLSYARDNGVPVLFQSIEDPPHFKDYLPVAQCADHIFTSAIECVGQYKKACPHASVAYLGYGVNPSLQNPVGAMSSFADEECKSVLFFAGSYYGKQYLERHYGMTAMFDGAIESLSSSLLIADRNMGKDCMSRYRFPARYLPYVIPPIDHAALQAAHKLFGWTINLNSVTDSRTMCAMRVYEVQALGGLLLTNYSLSTATRFPGVFTVFDSGEVGRIVDGYSERELTDMRVEGVRDMYSGCTVYDRLGEMLEACGLGTRPPVLPVYVVCAEGDAAARALFEAQECPGKVAVSPAEAASLEGPGYLVVPDGADHGPFWLLDMVNAFKFCDPDYVRYSPEAEWRSSYEFCEGEATARGTLYDLSRVRAADVLSGVAAPGGRGFRVLEPAWGRDTSGIEKELAVVIAVRDDGEELWKRCFRSLLRSSAFARMRVYLVDGGSSDGRTPAIARWIAGRFDNVEAIFLEDGGAGWRSRAWNRGIEAAGEPYVTFLSADCEAVGDGYAKLLERAKEGCQVAVGGWRDVRGRMRDCVIWDPTPHREGEEPLIANCAPGIDSGIASASKEGAFGRIELGLGDINPGMGIYSRALFDGGDREIGVGLIRSLVDNGAYGYVPSLVITAYSRELRSDDPSLGLPFLRQELRDAKNKMAGALSSGDDAPFANGRELPFDEDRLSRWKAALMDLSPDDRKEALPILEELLACYSVD